MASKLRRPDQGRVTAIVQLVTVGGGLLLCKHQLHSQCETSLSPNHFHPRNDPEKVQKHREHSKGGGESPVKGEGHFQLGQR